MSPVAVVMIHQHTAFAAFINTDKYSIHVFNTQLKGGNLHVEDT